MKKRTDHTTGAGSAGTEATDTMGNGQQAAQGQEAQGQAARLAEAAGAQGQEARLAGAAEAQGQTAQGQAEHSGPGERRRAAAGEGEGTFRQAEAIADFISGGIEHGCGSCLGLEIEHFVVTAEGHRLVPYADDAVTGAPGIATILERLAPYYDARIFEEQEDGSRALIGLSRLKANVTLEPGAQLEISIGPAVRLSTLQQLYRAFRAELDPLLAECGYVLLTLGYHPSACAFEIPLIPKQRYRYMDRYFQDTGRHGICMMRATASTQVSIDFASEEDAVRKFRVATALGPLLAFITDNSPVFEGMPVGQDAGEAGGEGNVTRSGLPVPARMAHTTVWDDVDSLRSMCAPHLFEPEFGFTDYGASLLAAPAIFTLAYDDDMRKRAIYQGTRPFSEVFSGHILDLEKVEHILSLFFFDVRFKTYIEIRMADSLPPEYAFAYAALIAGIFYDEANLSFFLTAFEGVDEDAIARAKAALRHGAWEATVYDRPASAWLDEMIERARGVLSAEDQACLQPLAELVARRTTLLDEYRASLHAG